MAVAQALIAECCVLLNLRGQMVPFSHRCELGLVLLTLGEEHAQSEGSLFLLAQQGAMDHLSDSFCCLEIPGSSEFNTGFHWATGQWGL